jgi:hypothetical protein
MLNAEWKGKCSRLNWLIVDERFADPRIRANAKDAAKSAMLIKT